MAPTSKNLMKPRHFEPGASTLDEANGRQWERIERVYRELKQNHEDRRDYERGGDFHYGEKEMRRRNPATPWRQRILLWLYYLSSGYGEEYLLPLLWLVLLLTGSAFAYLWIGIELGSEGRFLDPADWRDVLRALHFSLGVMTFLRPEKLLAVGYAQGVKTIQSLLGPLLLALLGFAVRQRLRR